MLKIKIWSLTFNLIFFGILTFMNNHYNEVHLNRLITKQSECKATEIKVKIIQYYFPAINSHLPFYLYSSIFFIRTWRYQDTGYDIISHHNRTLGTYNLKSVLLLHDLTTYKLQRATK